MRLVFQLPPMLGLVAPRRHQPSPSGCALEIDASGIVSVSGPSRTEIFDHTRRFLRNVAEGTPSCAMTAILRSPAGYWPDSSGSDGWTIIVINGEVAFAPTGTGVDLPPVEQATA